jgi:cation diffusion facilitator CzcD-associated flavoprotein CzcO
MKRSIRDATIVERHPEAVANIRLDIEMGKSLQTLEQALRREMELFAYPPRIWPRTTQGEDSAAVLDVVIIGAGQAGIALAFGLLRERITNILLIDRSDAGQEGPWVTWARMPTLRTIKQLTGPDNGLPSASFRSWYEARHGEQAWRNLVRIPKAEWMNYLVWLRRFLQLPVENETVVSAVTAEGDRLRVALRGPSGDRSVQARKVVVATGIDGSGGPQIPAFAQGLTKTLCAHSSEPIDFTALAGKRVAVLGAGASAFDNAATALEAGAREVTHYVRRPALPEVNALRFLEFTGFFRNFAALDDARKLRFMRRYLSLPTPPPADTLQRCRVHSNFVLKLAQGWTAMRAIRTALEITTPAGTFETDFAILGTGFKIDLASVPYLATLVPDMLFWKERLTLTQQRVDPRVDGLIGNYPYLGSAMQAVGRTPLADRGLRNLHFFNNSGIASVGPICSGINGMPWGVAALVTGISRDLFCADADAFYEDFAGYEEADANEAYKKQANCAPRRG